MYTVSMVVNDVPVDVDIQLKRCERLKNKVVLKVLPTQEQHKVDFVYVPYRVLRSKLSGYDVFRAFDAWLLPSEHYWTPPF